MPLHALAAANILDMLFHFGLSLEQQIEFFKIINIDKKYLEGFKPCGQALATLSKWVFEENLPESGDIAYEWRGYLDARALVLKEYKEKIAVDGSWNNIVSLYQSFMHMHCNRLMGPDIDKEKMALAYAQNTLGKLKYVLKNDKAQLNLQRL